MFRRVLSVVAVAFTLGAGYAVGNVAPWSAAEAAATTGEVSTRLLPACAGNHPETGGDDLCGAATSSCPEGATLMTEWVRAGRGGWTAQQTLCVSRVATAW